MNPKQAERMRSGQGFVAALDQSGGSTPKALRLYGIPEDSYHGEDEMFNLVHAMRCRIIESPSFTSRRILAAILFEMTMDRQVAGEDTAAYLWNRKGIVPFLKVDKGLAKQADGVQLMKDFATTLDDLLDRANAKGVFGTKMRSVIHEANEDGIHAIVDQQFAYGDQIRAAGLVPIIEPEVDIKSPDKAACEAILRDATRAALDARPDGLPMMLKLTIPSVAGFYDELIAHPRVLRVVALSGGYSRERSNELLAQNHGLIASFSRALTEGLTAQLSDAEFDAALDASIQSIYDASIT